jgi:hypothetical protein
MAKPMTTATTWSRIRSRSRLQRHHSALPRHRPQQAHLQVSGPRSEAHRARPGKRREGPAGVIDSVNGWPHLQAASAEKQIDARAWIVAGVECATCRCCPGWSGSMASPHADWQQFLGRFHPLVVHLPIGLLVLVPLLEIAGAFRACLREAAGSCSAWHSPVACLRSRSASCSPMAAAMPAGQCHAAHGGRNRADHRCAAVPAGAPLVVIGNSWISCIRSC